MSFFKNINAEPIDILRKKISLSKIRKTTSKIDFDMHDSDLWKITTKTYHFNPNQMPLNDGSIPLHYTEHVFVFEVNELLSKLPDLYIIKTVEISIVRSLDRNYKINAPQLKFECIYESVPGKDWTNYKEIKLSSLRIFVHDDEINDTAEDGIF